MNQECVGINNILLQLYMIYLFTDTKESYFPMIYSAKNQTDIPRNATKCHQITLEVHFLL